jgi:hypothetical protein
VCALAGEQPGVLVQLPQHLVVLERLRDRLPDHLAHPRLAQAGIEAADVGHDRGDRVGAVVGTAAGATWLAMLVAVGDLPGVPADGTGFGGTPSAAVTR